MTNRWKNGFNFLNGDWFCIEGAKKHVSAEDMLWTLRSHHGQRSTFINIGA